MIFRAFSVAFVLGLGCANVDSVPYCQSADEVPVATLKCRAEPDVRRMAWELAALIDEEAGPYLIQVGFDEFGGVESMCAQRSPHVNPWHPRKLLAERSVAIRAVAPGSPCLSGTRLDFNWTGVLYAEIDAVKERCASEAQPGAEAPLPTRMAIKIQGRRYRQCIEQAQIQRGEIWGLVPGQIFVRSDTGTERAAAIRTCAQDVTSSPRAPFDAQIQAAIVNVNTVNECMRDQGWQPLFVDGP